MPGRRRLKVEVSSYYAEKIERQAGVLEREIIDAMTGLHPFRPHGEALRKLIRDVRTGVNIINNLPPDYHCPNKHMSPDEAKWHGELVSKAKASRSEHVEDYDYDQSSKDDPG